MHPGLVIEDDMRMLMSEEKELASLLLQDPDLPSQQRRRALATICVCHST